MDTSTPDRLRLHWNRLLGDQTHSAAANGLYDDLVARYDAPDRHYHNLNHILHMLTWLTAHSPGPADKVPLGLAVWFHDAVYDTHAADNEEQSANLARTALTALNLKADLVDQVARLILLTRTHKTSSDDQSGLLFLDADLAILGAEPAHYDAYAAAIRQEYAWVPEEIYRPERLRVLEAFRRRPRIYLTSVAFAAYEEQAKDNLEREGMALAIPTHKK